MKRITVLGGSGFLGSKTAKALRAVPGVEVLTASRRDGIRVDVTRRETFTSLLGTDLLVDLSDATSHAPDELIDYCLANGVTVIEATSDSPCIERLHRRFASTSGSLVLGGGIFTGMSNLLARDVAGEIDDLEALSLGISWSPFCGAGRGTIELMLAMLTAPVPRYKGDRRIDDPGPSRGPDLELTTARRASIRIPFAESFMLHESTGARDVDVFCAPKQAFVVSAFDKLPKLLTHSALGQALLRAYFTLLRRVVFRTKPSSVEMVATAKGKNSTVTRRLDTSDGMWAGAWALAALAEAALAGTKGGVQFIDDVARLEPTVARANQLAGKTVLEVTAPCPTSMR